MTSRVQLTVRSYEIDLLGHVNHAVYHQWGEHGRTTLLAAAGCAFERMVPRGVSPVMLGSTIRFVRELRTGAVVEITSEAVFGPGKTFRIDQVVATADGATSAEISSTLGVFDLTTRRLRPDPAGELRAFATDPDVLGLPAAAAVRP